MRKEGQFPNQVQNDFYTELADTNRAGCIIRLIFLETNGGFIPYQGNMNFDITFSA